MIRGGTPAREISAAYPGGARSRRVWCIRGATHSFRLDPRQLLLRPLIRVRVRADRTASEEAERLHGWWRIRGLARRGRVGPVRATRGALTRSVIAASMIATRVIGCMGVDPNLLAVRCAQRLNCRAVSCSQSKFGRPSQKSRVSLRADDRGHRRTGPSSQPQLPWHHCAHLPEHPTVTRASYEVHRMRARSVSPALRSLR